VTEPLRITTPLRVRYAECDAQGIAFNANYVAWFDVANTELWRAAVGSFGQLRGDHGVDIVIGELTTRFRSPARFDDELLIDAWTDRIGVTSMDARYVVRRGDEVLAEGDIRYVFVGPQTWEKVPAPAAVRRALGVGG